ncbi:MAG: TIM-barrel domain-containing protein [Phycisphaerae bacterium]
MLLRSKIVTVLFLSACFLTARNAAAKTTSYYPAHDPGVLVDGHARFTVITPTLLRMEYSNTGAFINNRSYFAFHRNIKPPVFHSYRQGATLILKTADLTLRYTSGKHGFMAKNLSIKLHNGDHISTWHPGLKQTGNLGGTVRTLDGCHGPFPLPNGVLSRRGWYLFNDKTFLLTNGPKPWCLQRPSPGETDWYFFGYGVDHYRTALRDLTTVSGSVPLPRRYALGAWHSRWWNFTQGQFKQLVRDYAIHKFPLDVFVMDMGWHKTDNWTGFSWNRHLLPHPRQLLAWLHRRGLHITLNLHPAGGVGPYETRYKEFCKGMGINPAAQKQIPFDCTSRLFMHNYYKFMLDPLEREGVSFWWLDWQQGTTSAIPGVDPLPWLNELDFRDSQRPGTHRRGLSFSRWGGWGDQRYPVQFSGDTAPVWPVLKFEVPFTSTAGNVGCFYWIHDTGGFGGTPSPQLYTRWVQFSSASTALRTHACNNPTAYHRPWFFGLAAQRACRRAFALRARLFPYIYTAAWRCHRASVPLSRPMYFDYSRNPLAYKFPEEYTLGRNVLVAPIVAPGRGPGKIGQAQVWFPKGVWYNLFTGEAYSGGHVVPVWAQLDQFPIFAQGGVPIPMQHVVMRMAAQAPNPLVVTVYPGSNGKSIFYEDNGLTKGYLHGHYAITPLAYRNAAHDSVRIKIGAAQGSYAGESPVRNVVIRLPQTSRPVAVKVNGKAWPDIHAGHGTGYSYFAGTVTTTVSLNSVPVNAPEVVSVQFNHARARATFIQQITNRLAEVTRAMAGQRADQYGWVFKLDQIQFDLETLRSQVAEEPFHHATAWKYRFILLCQRIAAVAQSRVSANQPGAHVARLILAGFQTTGGTPGAISGALSSPPASAENQATPINISHGAAAWVYYGYNGNADGAIFSPGNVANFSPLTGIPGLSSAGGYIWLTFHKAPAGPSTDFVFDQAPAAGANGNSLSFQTMLIAPSETLKLYLVSFDSKANLAATLNSGGSFSKIGVVLPYSAPNDGDGTGSGHGYGVLTLRVKGKIGEVLTFTDTNDIHGVKKPALSNIGIQAVRITIPEQPKK